MASVILVPTGITDAATNIASGSEVDIDNGVGTPQDGALVVTKTDAFTTGTVTFALSDLPGDFDTVNTVQWRVRGQYVNPGDESDTAEYTLTLTGTGAPLINAVWDQTDNGSALENRGETTPASSTATEAQINAWTVVLDQTAYAKSMSNDGLYLNISEIEVLVDYDLAATAPVLTLPTEANITQTSATVGCTTDTAAGILYWFVDDIITPPSASALKAGTGAIDYGNVSTPGIGTETFNTSVTLDYNTNYYTYFIHNDTSDSNLLESGVWSTLDAASDAETFGITLDTLQQSNKLTSETESFDLTLDEINLVNKLTSISQTFDLTLDQLQAYSLLISDAITFDLTLDQIDTISRITYNAEIFGVTLDEAAILNKITSGIKSFDLILDDTNLVNKLTNISQTFDLTLDQLQVISVLLIEAATFGLILDQVEINQADKIESFLAALILDQQQSNIKTSEGLINFITNLNYQILKQLATNLSITLNTTLDHQFLGSTEAIINAAITFLANVDQIQTNVITADKAATFILDAAEQYGTQLDRLEVFTLAIVASDTYVSGRGLLESISFDTEINQIQTNTLDKVLLMSFNAALDKSITTQGSSFGAIINFASALSYTFNTDGEVSASILYGMDLDQQEQSNKLTDLSMDFSIDTDIITEIHLVVEGQIDFSTIMDKIEAKELLGQKGITFGHIHGLAALNSAVTGESISFGAIQDFEVNGFVASFTILTPNDRILKVYVIDRTSLIDEEIRVIRVNKT